MLANSVARNLGKLFRNIRDPKWLAAQAGETAVQQVFISPLGHKAGAYLRVHLFDGDQKVGEVYQCPDGHQYIRGTDGKRYALHPDTEDWHHA